MGVERGGHSLKADGQYSLFDSELTPGTYVTEHGKRLTFRDIENRIGKTIIIDVSTESHRWLQAALVERIIDHEGTRRLIYYHGKKQRGLVNAYYFRPDWKPRPVMAYDPA